MEERRAALLTRFVLDNSVVMSWCFEDEKGSRPRKILERLGASGALVPALWPLELANVLLTAERHKRLSQAEAAQFLRYVSRFPIDVDRTPLAELVEGCSRIARQCHVSAYDAAYLFLASREGIPLATFDADMVKAAHRLNVELV